MPRGKKYDPTINAKRTVYYRSIPEAYGPSVIWLNPLQPGDNVIKVNNQDVWLPVLDIEKYYPGAKCYALIEKLDNFPVAMVDVLYSYQDLSPMLEKDKFLEDFLRGFTRAKINALNLKSPALTVSPADRTEAERFALAREQALRERLGTDIVCLTSVVHEEMEVENKEQAKVEVKPDNIIIDFIKSFYEAISRKPIKRPSTKKTKTVDASLLRELRMMKSGATVVPGAAIGKYFTSYYVEMQIGDEVNDINDELGIHFESIDDQMLISQEPEEIARRERFRDILFDSTILETYMEIFADKKPKLIFAGAYNERAGRMQVDKRVANYFNELNELIVPTRPSGDGR